MTSRISYSELCNQFARCECAQNDLTILKSRFQKEISSRRRIDCIDSPLQLINVLEKRDVLNEDNVEVLHEIATILKQIRLQSQVEQYKCYQNMPVTMPPICKQQVLRVLPQKPTSRKQHAYMIISKEIGKNWKELARALLIREGQIDELELRHPRSIEDRVLEVLDYSGGEADPCVNSEWRSCMLNALTKARRNDLRCSVEHVLNTGSELI